MGRLQDALDLYVQIGQDFPANVVAQSGRASLLVSMGRYKEARALLPDKSPTSRDDWINHHILAMSYLKAGDTHEALRRLTYGLDHVPWEEEKKYYISALGIARMMNNQFEDAIETLQSNIKQVHGVRQQAQLLTLSHAQAKLERETDARQSLAAVGEVRHVQLIKLRDDVVRRYGLNGEKDTPLTKDEADALDRRIEASEFFFALAA